MNELANELNALNRRHHGLRDHHTAILREHERAIDTLRQDLATSNLDLIPTTIANIEHLQKHHDRLQDRVRDLENAYENHAHTLSPDATRTSLPKSP